MIKLMHLLKEMEIIKPVRFKSNTELVNRLKTDPNFKNELIDKLLTQDIIYSKENWFEAKITQTNSQDDPFKKSNSNYDAILFYTDEDNYMEISIKPIITPDYVFYHYDPEWIEANYPNFPLDFDPKRFNYDNEKTIKLGPNTFYVVVY